MAPVVCDIAKDRTNKLMMVKTQINGCQILSKNQVKNFPPSHFLLGDPVSALTGMRLFLGVVMFNGGDNILRRPENLLLKGGRVMEVIYGMPKFQFLNEIQSHKRKVTSQQMPLV